MLGSVSVSSFIKSQSLKEQATNFFWCGGGHVSMTFQLIPDLFYSCIKTSVEFSIEICYIKTKRTERKMPNRGLRLSP
ncbi:hypothetical protein SRHO_G00264720 [Serrasalmus rhombeus]